MFEMPPISVTLVTGPMRDTMPSDGGGQLGLLAEGGAAGLHGEQVAELAQLVQQARLRRLGDAEHADDGGDADADPERGQRRPHPPAAQPEAPDPEQVAARQPGAAGCQRAGRRVTDDPPVSDLDAPLHGGGHLEVVGDDHDGRALSVQLAEQFQDGLRRSPSPGSRSARRP